MVVGRLYLNEQASNVAFKRFKRYYRLQTSAQICTFIAEPFKGIAIGTLELNQRKQSARSNTTEDCSQPEITGHCQ